MDSQQPGAIPAPRLAGSAPILPDRDRIFQKLEIACDLTDRFSGVCPEGCTQCEERESLLLLPYEDELIKLHLAREGRPSPSTFQQLSLRVRQCKVSVGYSQGGGPPCPMMERGTGMCAIYKARPLDCRSFPLVPRFLDNGGLDFYLARYCPIALRLSPDFIRVTKQVWQMLLEDLPLWWRRLYNHDSARERRVLIPLAGRSAATRPAPLR